MYPRQRWLFGIGGWVALASAALHLVGFLTGRAAPPANDTERQLQILTTTYRLAFPGGTERSYDDLMTGFSLALAVTLSAFGLLALRARRATPADSALLFPLARVLTAASAAMLVLSLRYFFIVPTMCLALMVTCFGLASVTPPTPPPVE